MKASLLFVLILTTTGYFSCGQGSQRPPSSIVKENSTPTEQVQSQNPFPNHLEKFIDTKYQYSDPAGSRVIVQNSLPKGGLKYTDPNGREYVYAVFWTRITNATATPLKLKINFPVDSLELQSSPGRYFRVLLPPDSMTLAKENLFNYGLTDIGSVLENIIHQQASLERTIPSNGSGSFYFVTLFNQGIGGALRTGLSIKGQNLFYRIHDKEIPCGMIDLALTELTKSQRAVGL